MNQTMETILSRRSIRNFDDRPVKKEDLELMVQAALHAPSGMGLQTWKFTVVRSQEKIKRLASAIETELNRPGYDMYCPQALIIPSNERDSKYIHDDNACALENIFLAAHSLGIGSVWINQLNGICDRPAIRAVLQELQIPENHVITGLVALGYADDTPIKPKERIGQVAWIDE